MDARYPTRLTVRAPDGSYPIYVGAGLRWRLADIGALYGLRGRVAVVSSEGIAAEHARAVTETLPNATLLTIADGEGAKNLATVERLYSQMIEAGIQRDGTMLALGGGVLGDAAGFAAASYLRGIRFVQMPSTLLAMVDSSVGSKVGINLRQGKNLVGAFLQPAAVILDPELLETLPPIEWRCGMAEVLKHGLLADEELLAPRWLQRGRPTAADLPELLRRALRVKIDVVEADPFEQGRRAHLNLGHTFAHAVEQVSGYRWKHGEAVGVGTLAAARLSARLGLCEAGLAARVDVALAALGLPRQLEAGMAASALYAAMATDKKWVGGRSRFVLLRGIGRPEIVWDVPEGEVLAVLRGLGAG